MYVVALATLALILLIGVIWPMFASLEGGQVVVALGSVSGGAVAGVLLNCLWVVGLEKKKR